MTDKFDPDEVPTSPDPGVLCPECKGNGDRLMDLADEEHPTRVRQVRRFCPECEGRKRLTREEYARYLAG